MLPFRQILFPVDFSEPCRKMAPDVLCLAQAMNCPVTLLHAYQLPIVFYGDLGPIDSFIPSDLQPALEAQLRQFAAEFFPAYPHSQVIVQGDASEEIHKFVQRNGTDLIMMPTSGNGPLRRLLLGSITAKVLHDVSCPVWTNAHTAESPAHPHWPIKSILCAVSLEDESVAIAKAASAFATIFNARLTLFSAFGYPHPAIDVDYEHYRRQMLEESTQKLQSLRWENKINAATTVSEGSAIQCIREQAASVNADLVIVGRGHAQGAVSRLWSDLYDVIRESPCPVLSI